MENIDKRSRDKLITKALDLFREKGFHNITMDDIAKSCNIKKASVYHHIPSRNELVTLALKEEFDFFEQSIFSKAHDKSLPEKERVKSFMLSVDEFYTQNKRGSFIGSLVSEDLTDIPEAKMIVKAFFKAWFKAIETLFEGQLEPEEAVLLAEDIVSQLKGAIRLGYLEGTRKLFQRAIERMDLTLAS